MRIAASLRRNPYPGLTPFNEADAEHFFGRDHEIEEVLDRMATYRLLAVVGMSGCGKSSLIRAGVLPILRMGIAPTLPTRWRICIMNPGAHPLRSLRAALDAPNGWPTTSFDLIDHARSKLVTGENLLLIVDQFEELLRFRNGTMPRDGNNAASLFVSLLLKAVEQHVVPIYILLTMRTDFLGECAQFHGLAEALNDCTYLLPRLTWLKQQEAIERPLEGQGATMHPALVQRLLNESAENPDQLPALQHLLRRLWENWNAREKRPGEPIGDSDYRNVGGWSDVLNFDAEEVLKEFADAEEGIRRLFQWITERGTRQQPVRRPRPLSECVEVSGLKRERLKEIVGSFQKRGLLRHSDLSDESLVDLSHETVMWQWLRLRQWIAEEAEQASQLRFFLQSACEQNQLTGLAAESASRWRRGLGGQGPSAQRYLNPEELERTVAWIVHSEKSEKTRRRRRSLVFSAIGGLVAILIVGANWIALQQRNSRVAQSQRNSAEARELLAWSAVSLSDDPERSMILGLHSWGKQRAMVPGLEELLHSAVLQSFTRLTLSGHRYPVNGVAWSPDGMRLATASNDSTAKIWNSNTGRDLLTLTGHQGLVLAVAWSPNGNKLATAGSDQTIKVWETSTGRELLTLHGHQQPVISVAWSPDGSKLATASNDSTAKLWDARTGRELLTFRGHRDSVESVAWSPNGSWLATASDDKTAKVWDGATGRELLTLHGHQGKVFSIAWSPNGSKLATGSYDQAAKVWDARTGREVLTLRSQEGLILSVAWSPDGSKLAATGGGKTASVWEADSGRQLLILRDHQATLDNIAWSPDGSRLATADSDNNSKIWDASGGMELQTLRGHQDRVSSVGWSPDGRKLATASYDNTAKVWNPSTGWELQTLRGHQVYVLSVAWSPDGSKLATGSADDTARIWETTTGRQLLNLTNHQAGVQSIAWSPDGSKVATASADGTAKIWEADTGRELLTFKGHEGYVQGVAWSPDGSKVATASADNTAKVWEAKTGRELFTFAGHQSGVLGVAWSPDGSKVATASADNTAKVWDTNTGRQMLTLKGHEGYVRGVAWSPDGSKLATASADNTTKVWDARSGSELVSLNGHQDSVLSVAWSPDGKLLASASADKTVQVYTIDQIDLIRLVRSRITRGLTSDECLRYLHTDKCPALPDLP